MVQYNKGQITKDLGIKNKEVDEIIKKLQISDEDEPEDRNLFTDKEENKTPKKPEITR